METSLELMNEELEGQIRRDIPARRISMVLRETERVAKLVRHLRDLSWPAHPEQQPTDINDVLEDVIQLASKQLRYRKVTVRRALEVDLPLIQANWDHLSQALMHLLLSALARMPDGGILSVRTARDQMAEKNARLVEVIRIELRDTGAGMSPEMLAQLFDPLAPHESAGTGLGLVISYEIIQAHNGQITVTSQEGQGSTFTILLPVRTE